MSDLVLKEILKGINQLKERMNRLEWLIMELKSPEVGPTPEERKLFKNMRMKKKDLNSQN